MQDSREFRINVGDDELSVLEWQGEGDPILLLHATGFHSRCWNQVVEHLPGQHVFAVDLRFHGGSVT
jgi:pimeloyl-ACP methyl ester carboxylesterase